MKKVLLFFISLFVGAGLLIWTTSFIGWEKIALSFRFFSFRAGIIILSLTALAIFIRTWRWKTILKNQGYKIPVLRVLEYYLSGNAITFFVPMVIFGGEVFRGYDLKEKYGVPWADSISSVVIDRILELTIYAVATVFGVIFFLFYASPLSYKTGLIIFSAIFLIVTLISLFYFKSFKKESVIRFLLKKFNARNLNGAETAIKVEKEIFRYFRPNKKTMWQGFGLSLLVELTLWARTFFLILFLGKNISAFLAVSVVAFSSLTFLVPIPAALGSHEVVQSFVFTALGLTAGTGAAFVLVIRGAELVLALIGLLFFFKFGINFLQSLFFKKVGKLVDRLLYKNNEIKLK